MSFILEALRKSENERQRLGNTAIADLPVARPPRSQPWWMIAIAVLLVVNIGVLAVVLLRKAETPAPASTTPVQAAGADASALQTAPLRNILEEEALPPAQVQYETVPRSEMELAEAAASVPEGPRLVQPTNGASPAANEFPTGLPAAEGDLRIDMHVFAPNVRDRFVLINMRRYLEGETLPNGATVEQITPAGVVLYRDGSRYELRR